MIRRWAPAMFLLVMIGLFFLLDLQQYLNLQTLKDNRNMLQLYVANHAVIAPVLFMIIYVTVTATSVPGASVLTIAGGALFGSVWGTGYVVISATMGATILFLVARSAFGDSLRTKAGPWMDKLSSGFSENAFNYLLFLRLIPLFPFFVVNLVPAFLNIRTRTYVLATLFGIIPGSFVYTSVGEGLDSIVNQGVILTPQVIIALVGLAILSILPVIYKKLRN